MLKKNASKHLLTPIHILVVSVQAEGCLQEDLLGEKFQLISTGMFLRSPETLVRFFALKTWAHLAPFQLLMYYKESLEAEEILTLLVFSSPCLRYSLKLGKPTKPQSATTDEIQTCCHNHVQQRGWELLKIFSSCTQGFTRQVCSFSRQE